MAAPICRPRAAPGPRGGRPARRSAAAPGRPRGPVAEPAKL